MNDFDEILSQGNNTDLNYFSRRYQDTLINDSSKYFPTDEFIKSD